MVFFNSAVLPNIDSLHPEIDSDSALTLNCSSSGSPAATVVWTKNSVVLSDGNYSLTQILRDGTTAAYDNLIAANATPTELVGLYSCVVHDTLGHNSEVVTLEVKGIMYYYSVTPHNAI